MQVHMYVCMPAVNGKIKLYNRILCPSYGLVQWWLGGGLMPFWYEACLGCLQLLFLCFQSKQHWSTGNVSPHLSHFSAASLLFSWMSIPLASLLSLTEADRVAGFECPTDSGLAHHAHLYCSEIDRREAVTECAPACWHSTSIIYRLNISSKVI